MKCPVCDAKTRVLQTRDYARTRRCPEGHTFTTHEVHVGAAVTRSGSKPRAPLGPTQLLVLNTLGETGLTVHGLMAALPDVSRTQIMAGVQGLRYRNMVYIGGYVRRPGPGGRAAPVYVVGARDDALEPSTPKAELARNRRARKAAGVWAGLTT